tara:strand:+ start:1147 stop:2445 length:1299 start_codon:yes stop_codon:yes gene_type:complete
MDRSKIILQNVSLSFVFKIFNMGIVYFTIPFLLQYLGKTNYGIWVTIFSVVNILFFVDAGIANGLKTKLTEALSLNNYKLAKEYISTAYVSIFFISFSFLLIGTFILKNINFASLLNVGTSISNEKLVSIFFVALIFIVSNFILSLYKTLFYSIQKSSIVEFSMFLYQILIFALIYYAVHNLQSSILYVAYFYGASNVIVSIVFNFVFFYKRKQILPSIKSFKKNKIKELMGLSLGFFMIQLCMIIIFTTDNLIISNLLGPDEVTGYDIVLKLFQVITILSIVMLEPFWALFTNAFQKKDYTWIKETLIKLNKVFLLVFVGTVLIVLLTEEIVSIWIGKSFIIENKLTYFMGIFVLVRVYPVMYMFFLNAIGKIKLQVYLYVIGAIINIPLSILFIKYFNLGVSGVILGTICSIFSMTLLLPYQTIKILKQQ